MNQAPGIRPPTLAAIFFSLLRIGCTAFGGPAMVPYIRRLAVDREGWLKGEDFDLGLATVQLIPGATAMQVAAFVGLTTRGVRGAVAAFTGFGLPAFVLMAVFARLYFEYRAVTPVAAGLGGLKAAVVALMLVAAWDFGRRYLRSSLAWALALGTGVAFSLKLHPALILLLVCSVAAWRFPDSGGCEGGPVRPGLAAWLPALQVGGGLLLTLGALAVFAPDHFSLAAMMARIDCFAFGGGYVSLPIMLHEVVGRGIMSESAFMDGIALGQITPGPVVMTAAFVGQAVLGLAGAATATLFVFWPSLFFLTLAVPCAQRLKCSALARRALAGSLVSLVGLMGSMALRFGLAVSWTWIEALVCLGAVAALRLRVGVVWVVLVAGLLPALSVLL